MSRFIEAYVVATGVKVRVPRAWVDHPVLWQGLRKTPSDRARDAALSEAKGQTDTIEPANMADTERSDA